MKKINRIEARNIAKESLCPPYETAIIVDGEIIKQNLGDIIEVEIHGDYKRLEVIGIEPYGVNGFLTLINLREVKNG